MDSPWLRLLIAFACAIVLTPVARRLAQRLGAIDRPDGKRKLHERPVPLFGGVAVFLSVAVGLLVTIWGPLPADDDLIRLCTVLLPVAGFVCLFGVVDDVWDLPAKFKLLLQIAAASVVVSAGYWVDWFVVFGYRIELGWLGVPITILWLVGCINALNLLDGMDGLASMVGLLTSLMMAAVATLSGHDHVAELALVMAGALAGFLVFNLPPASIYLGDSGSMVIGLFVGMLGIQGSLKTTATLSITAPAVIMCIPMLDIVMAIIRRRLTGRRFDAADRGHIHHRLLDRGLSTWQALSLISALCLMTGAAATASTIFSNDLLAWITALTMVALLIVTRMFGHYELSLLKVWVGGKLAVRVGSWAASHRSQGVLTRRRQLLNLTFDEVWQRLVADISAFGIDRIEFVLQQPGGDSLRQHCWSRHEQGTERREKAPQDEGRTEATLEPESDDWSLTLGFATQRQGCCKLYVQGPAASQPEPVDMLVLSSHLKLYGQYLALNPHKIPQTSPLVVPFAQRRSPVVETARTTDEAA